MAFPLLFVVLCLSLGILFASSVSLPLCVLVAAMFLSLIGAWMSLARHKNLILTLTSLLLSCFFLGGGLFTLSDSRYKTNALTIIETREYIDFQGRLYKTPTSGLDRQFLFLKVEKIFREGRSENMDGRLRISLLPSSQLKNSPELSPGDRIRVSARISARGGTSNFQGNRANFSFRAERIHASAFTKSALLIKKLSSGSPFSPMRLMARLRKQLQKQIEAHFWSSSRNQISEQGAVMEALLLGQRGRLDPKVLRSLQNSGLYHLLAISGAHVAILCLFLFQLLKVLRVPKRIAYLFLMVFLVFYTFLVEARPSVFRAALMTVMYLLGKLLWKDSNHLNSISLSALVLLVLNPFNLFTLGFQLTFVATLSILLFFPRVVKKLPRFPFRLGEVFAVTLTAQAGVLPLIAANFNRVVLSSLILNFVALPLLFIIMAGGFFFLPLSFLSAVLAGLWSQGMAFCIDLLLAVAGISSGAMACLSYRIPTPHLWTCLGYFLSGLLLLAPPRYKKPKVFIACFFLIFLGILLSYPFPSSSKFLKVTFIDVGQGDSILVEFPGQKKMLIDGGGSSYGSFDVGEYIVSPFLWRKGIKRIDYLVSTHPHPDHMRGLLAVMKNFKINEYCEALSYPEDPHYIEAMQTLPQDTFKRKLFRGDVLNLDGIWIEALNPQSSPAPDSAHSNNFSLVLRISDHRTAFLLTGDIEASAEQEILSGAHPPQAAVLKAPHHGSNSSSSLEFLQAVSPQFLVISVGKYNRYNFPHSLVLERYASIGAKVYRTDHQGAIEITSGPNGCTIRTSRK